MTRVYTCNASAGYLFIIYITKFGCVLMNTELVIAPERLYI